MCKDEEIQLGTSPQLEGKRGVYLENCGIAATVDPNAPDAMKAGAHPHAADPDSAARLWSLPGRLTSALKPITPHGRRIVLLAQHHVATPRYSRQLAVAFTD